MSKPLSKQAAQKPAERVSKPKRAAEVAALEQASLVDDAGSRDQINRLPDHPTSQHIRQASILRMQRRQGNGAVQRVLRGRQAAVREGDDAWRQARLATQLGQRSSGDSLLRQVGEQETPSEEEKSTAEAAAQAAEGRAGQATAQAQQAAGGSQEAASQEQQAAEDTATPVTGGPVGQGGSGPALTETAQQESQAPGGEQSAGQAMIGAGGEGGAAGDQAPASPEEDPGFLAFLEKIRQLVLQEKKHPPAKKKARQAQDAAESPQAETESQARSGHVKELQATKAPPAKKAGLKAQIMQQIQALTPSTAGEADRFKSGNKLGGLKSELKGKVAEEKAKSIEPMKQKSQEGPKQAGIAPKPVTPLPPPQPMSPLPQFDAAPAAPKPKPKAQVEKPLKEQSKSLDEQMAEAGITEEQLKNSNEPEFQSALEAKKEAQQKAKESPQAYRQQEQEQISQATEEVNSSANQELQGMQAIRQQLMGQVGQDQSQAKSNDEKKRQEVAAAINAIYDRTRTSVEEILNGLDARVIPVFEAGAAAAQATFENFVSAQMEAYKQRRYGGMLGWARWAKDKLLGLPAEVNQFFAQGRQMFISQMDAVLTNVTAIITSAIQQARAAVLQGRMEIDAYVSSLPADLQQVGQEAAAEIQDRFDQLETEIAVKEQGVIEILAAQYQAHLGAVDAQLQALQSQNQGLLSQAGNAIQGVVRKITTLKEGLTSVLSQVGSAVRKIMRNPVGFVGNLLGAVKTGLTNFVGNVATHLRKGLVSWLFKALSDAGIELPDSFDLKGILALVTRVLGVTWEHIRSRAVALFGERVVGVLENAFDIFRAIKSEGLGGLFRFAQDKASGIKDAIMNALRQMLVSQVIQKGIQRLLGIIGSPAGAFVAAVGKIHQVVTWFVSNGRQVAGLVSAIMESVAAVAGGAAGQASQFIERALARAIPATISFLADLVGLGDIPGKIRQVIGGVRGSVDRLIGWVLDRARGVASGLLGGGESAETGPEAESR